jgi:hypothetical protein
MKLYIQIENDQPINHPVFEDDLMQEFGAIPTNWELFTRVERPVATVYQVFDSEEPTYAKLDGVWTDVWVMRDMTNAEKATKQQEAKDAWAVLPNRNNFTAWVFDENTCLYEPPIPRPEDVTKYFWQGTTASWAPRPVYPNIDGKMYALDFAAATWVEVTP